MSIVASELAVYGSASRPQDDTSTSGGAIDLTNRPLLQKWTAAAVAQVASDGADTRQVTITGRPASGVLTTETLTLTGTTAVLSATTWVEVLKVVVSATDAARTVILSQGSGGPSRGSIAPNNLSIYAMFINATSSGAQTVRYEKVFLQNNDATNALLAAQVTLVADPDSRNTIALATAVNDTGSVVNRLTAPAGLTFVGLNSALNVPGTNLAAGAAIGVWVALTLPANDTPHFTTESLQLSGSTT